MKIAIENLEFPTSIIETISKKVSLNNLDINLINGSIIHFNNTNLNLFNPHKIIIKGSNNVLIAYIYEDSNKIFLPSSNAFITINKLINILQLLLNNDLKSSL